MSRQALVRQQLPRDIVGVTGAWARIRDGLSIGLVRDVQDVLRALPPTIDAAHTAAGAELFFCHILNDVDLRDRVAPLYSETPSVSPDSEAVIQAVTVAFQNWRIRPTGDRGGSEVSAYEHGLGAGRVLTALGGMPNRFYPPFKRPQLPVPRPTGNSPTFGALEWPELEGMETLPRERAGLSLVKRALSAAFDDLYRTFDFGRAVRTADGPPPGVDTVAWWKVRGFLQAAATSIAAYAAADQASAILLVGNADKSLRRADTWVHAGLPRRCVSRAWRRKPCANVFSLAALVGFQGGGSEYPVGGASGVMEAWSRSPTLP